MEPQTSSRTKIVKRFQHVHCADEHEVMKWTGVGHGDHTRRSRTSDFFYLTNTGEVELKIVSAILFTKLAASHPALGVSSQANRFQGGAGGILTRRRESSGEFVWNLKRYLMNQG